MESEIIVVGKQRKENSKFWGWVCRSLVAKRHVIQGMLLFFFAMFSSVMLGAQM